MTRWWTVVALGTLVGCVPTGGGGGGSDDDGGAGGTARDLGGFGGFGGAGGQGGGFGGFGGGAGGEGGEGGVGGGAGQGGVGGVGGGAGGVGGEGGEGGEGGAAAQAPQVQGLEPTPILLGPDTPAEIVATVTDADGDLREGVLTDGDGNVYGAFEPDGGDAWALTLTWAQAHAVAPIEFAAGAGQDRPLRAVFFDEGGRRGEAGATLRLTCGAAAACAGECVDLGRDLLHCGACGNVCGAGEACQGGVCAAPGTVIVTEFMPDPQVVTDNAGEYIELHNPGGAPVDLQGWTIGELADIQAGDGDFFVVEAPVVVPAGGYVVIARSLDAASNGGLPADYAARFSLRNGEDTIAVVDPLGEQVDLVAYDASFGWATGVAAQLRPDAQRSPAGNDAAGAWCGAPDTYGPGDNSGSPGGPARACR